MTLLEAIKSNKPFKRAKDMHWLRLSQRDDIHRCIGGYIPLIKAADIVMDDWIIYDGCIHTPAHKYSYSWGQDERRGTCEYCGIDLKYHDLTNEWLPG